MTLRQKVLLIVGIAIFSMWGTLYITSRFILMESLVEIEEYRAHQDTERAIGILSYTLADLAANTADWASWDDTYAFIEDANETYIKTNLLGSSFKHLRLNFMLFVDSAGKTVFSKGFNLENGEEAPIPPDLERHLSENGLLTGHRGEKISASGILPLEEGPVLVSAQPILTSEEKGPARGTVIFGRYFDFEEISRLTLNPITIVRIDEAANYPDIQVVLPVLSGERNVFIQPLNEQYVAGYTLIDDIYGKPALVARVDLPRDIYQRGQLSVAYQLLAIIGLGLLIGLASLLLVEKHVISRITRLTKGINLITRSSDISARLPAAGNDELKLVADTINEMLGSQQKSQEQLQNLYEHEKDLRQQLELEMRKRIEFTRALVHELKTPITPVLVASELLVEELKEEPLLGLARSIGRSASNLNQRIDELLDLARGEINKLKINPDAVDMMQLLQEIGDEVTPVALGKGQSLSLELPHSLNTIWVDRERIRQVLLNLLNNALKFTRAGGKIILRAKEDSTNLIVDVQDTGRGMSKEEQQRLFDPYYRVESDREILSGLGLGLALSKILVELHGGRIWAESQKGQGSKFSFSIPLPAMSRKEARTESGGQS